jgi:hypothetical protein
VILFAVSLFYLLLDQVALPFSQLRYLIVGIFGLMVYLPILLAFLPPRTHPRAYPPYDVQRIQLLGTYVKTNELTMSDVPWAMAWYARRQSVLLTRNAQEDFLAIHDYQKPIAILYLTPATTDNRFLSQWIRAGEQSWGAFISQIIVRQEVPAWFPLRKSERGWFPDTPMLADRERWPKEEKVE